MAQGGPSQTPPAHFGDSHGSHIRADLPYLHVSLALSAQRIPSSVPQAWVSPRALSITHWGNLALGWPHGAQCTLALWLSEMGPPHPSPLSALKHPGFWKCDEVIASFPCWTLNSTCQPPPVAWVAPERTSLGTGSCYRVEEKSGTLEVYPLTLTVPLSSGRAGLPCLWWAWIREGRFLWR